jgi:hypothetical protein
MMLFNPRLGPNPSTSGSRGPWKRWHRLMPRVASSSSASPATVPLCDSFCHHWGQTRFFYSLSARGMGGRRSLCTASLTVV